MKLNVEERLDLFFRYNVFNELPNSGLTEILKIGYVDNNILLRYNNILKIYIR